MVECNFEQSSRFGPTNKMHSRLFINLAILMAVAAKPHGRSPVFPLDVDLRCEIGGRVIRSGYTFYDNCNICRSASAL